MSTDLLARKRAHFFSALDKNHDNVLEKADVVKFLDALTGIRGWSPGSPEYQRIEGHMLGWWNAFTAAADVDDDGQVSCDEMAAVLGQATPQDFAGTADWLFDILDRDGAGTISAEEYRQYEQALFDGNPDPAETFALLDEDGDGVISREQFTQLLVDYHLSDDEKSPGNNLFGFRC